MAPRDDRSSFHPLPSSAGRRIGRAVAPKLGADPLLIVHQMGRDFEEAVAPHLPANVILRGLPPERAWDVPPDAGVLVAVPPRGRIMPPPTAPRPGWPGRLAWIQAVSAGVDEFPRWIFEGPVVTCGRGVTSVSIAEFVLASLLAVEKRFPGSWIAAADQWQRGELGGLHGKTLGVLGLGAIGTAVARLGLAFGMRVLAHRRTIAPSPLESVRISDLRTVLAEADHLVVCLPLTDSTRRLLGREAFGWIKPGVHLVNVSRGGVIDHQALADALAGARVGFASLDVTEPEPLPAGHPFYRHPRVHLSPHLSWSGQSTREPFGRLFLDNLARFRAGLPLIEQVSPQEGY